MISRVIQQLSFFLLLTGCGYFGGTPMETMHIDPAFKPYYEIYKYEKLRFRGTGYVKPMTIKFDDLGPGILGICDWGIPEELAIRIDRHFWSGFTDFGKTLLLFHELGHCDLDLDHTIGINIMNPYILDEFTFGNNEDYFFQLLFIEGR